MHKLLERQLKKVRSLEAIPENLRALLEDVDAAYKASDDDRMLLERSLDLTSKDLMQRNAALRESEARYRRMIETATEGIWVLGPDDRTAFINDRMAAMLGYDVDEMMGKTDVAFMDPDAQAAAHANLAQRRAGVSSQTDARFRRKDGSTVWAIVSASPIQGPDGSYQGTLSMVTDISARKSAEDELRNAYERLQELDRFRAEFINNAAHELGTPLTPIKLQLHLLRKVYAASLDANQRKATDILDRNVERISQLVADLLDVSRIQSGRLSLKLERTSIASCVEEAWESFQAPAVANGVSLEVSSEPGLECDLDPRRFGQILYNLLSNTLKFTPRGGRASLVARRVGDSVQIAVHDSGRGINPEDIKRLFKPFSQVHNTMEMSAPGTGLGLFICRGIAEQMGGRIWCESAGLGKGANFIVEFPASTTVTVKGRASDQGVGTNERTLSSPQPGMASA